MVKEVQLAYAFLSAFFFLTRFFEIRGHQWSGGRQGLHGIMKRLETYSRSSDNPSQESVLRGLAKAVSTTAMKKGRMMPALKTERKTTLPGPSDSCLFHSSDNVFQKIPLARTINKVYPGFYIRVSTVCRLGDDP